jgi:hypothetical protein
MKELGMGHDRYILIDLDNGGKKITAAEVRISAMTTQAFRR